MRKIFLPLAILSLVSTTVFAQGDISKSKAKTSELASVQDTLDYNVVLVNRHIYTKDRTITLKGKIRNISQKAYKNIYVVWELFDRDNKLIPHNLPRTYSSEPYEDKVDYLDAKAEADVEISLDLSSRMSMDSADAVARALDNGRHKIRIYSK